MFKILKFVFFIFLLTSSPALAVELWLKDIPLNKLEALYQEVGYQNKVFNYEKDYLMLDTYTYPPIFLKNFPKEFFAIEDDKKRANLFIKMLIPLVFKLNSDILAERKLIENIANKKNSTNLSAEEIKILEDKAAKYDVFTRLKGEQRYKYLTSELLLRIDIIPASIIISTAAIDTNYGQSRHFREGNSLYKILNWHSNEGLIPLGDEKEDYRLRTYPDIYASLQDFALRVNSHPNFEFVRFARSTLRGESSNPQIKGERLVAYSFANSELKNYAGIITYTAAYYELDIVDKSDLDFSMVTPKIAKKYSHYSIKK